MKYKVAIIDDHPLFREGFKTVLKSFDSVNEIKEFTNGEEFINFLKNDGNIDIAFMDIYMPVMDGVETTEKALNDKNNLKIIALTSFENVEYIDKMLIAGVEGYLLKDASYNEIEKAMERVMNGENYFSEKILVKLSRRAIVRRDEEKRKNDMPELSNRELEVLSLICQGKSRHEIAEQLFISERTVDKHKENLQVKTNTKNAVSLVLYAIKNKLTDISFESSN